MCQRHGVAGPQPEPPSVRLHQTLDLLSFIGLSVVAFGVGLVFGRVRLDWLWSARFLALIIYSIAVAWAFVTGLVTGRSSGSFLVSVVGALIAGVAVFLMVTPPALVAFVVGRLWRNRLQNRRDEPGI